MHGKLGNKGFGNGKTKTRGRGIGLGRFIVRCRRCGDEYSRSGGIITDKAV
jgi:hypothetical protein